MARRAKVIPFPGHPPEPAPRGSGTGGGRSSGDLGFVEVRRCRDQSEALVLKGLFETEGIHHLFRTRLAHSVHPFTVGDQGEVIVLVSEADAERARLLLARISQGPSFP